MKLSEEGRKILQGLETKSGSANLIPYQDGGKIWTWGYGHAKGPHEEVPLRITLKEAEDVFSYDVSGTEEDVNQVLQEEVPQHIFDALVWFFYNVGLTQLRAKPHRTLDAIKTKDWKQAAQRILTWSHDNGTFVQGLYNRRVVEVAKLMEIESM